MKKSFNILKRNTKLWSLEPDLDDDEDEYWQEDIKWRYGKKSESRRIRYATLPNKTFFHFILHICIQVQCFIIHLN